MFSVPEGELVYVSPAYETIWGRQQAALREDRGDWLNAVHPEDRAQLAAQWAALAQQPHFEEEYRICAADGGTRWVRDRVFPVRDTNNAVYRVARVTSDISRRKEMERLLRAADSNKNQFPATLAHELRNPLSPIRNAASLLGAGGEGARERDARAREVIMRQVDHLAHLVDDLLDVARISQGKIVLRREDVDLGAVIAQAVETAGPLLAARRHRLDVRLPHEQVWVSGDPVRLAESMGNLLHNAAKFTPAGGQVTVTASVDGGDTVRIAVQDNGIGIAEDNLARIFGMFAQAAVPPDRAPEGLGTGQIVALALRHRPQVIVLDIGLPGLDGYGVARMIRQHPELALVRLVAHTGYGSPEDRERAREAGFDGHLVKPAELADLEAALRG